MSDISKGVKAYLLTFTDLREHVVGRIHFDFLPEPGKGVSLVIEETFGQHHHQLSGAAGIYNVELRITCHSHDPSLRTTVAEIVREKMQGYRGTAGSEFVHSCELSFRDKRAVPADQSGVRPGERKQSRKHTYLYLSEMTFDLFVTESVPTP